MRKVYSLLFFLCITLVSVSGQSETVSMRPGYSHQVYYSLSTGKSEAVANDAWDIAFSAVGQRDAGIFINESAGFMKQAIKLYVAPTNDWNEKITDTSIFVDSVVINNSETSWEEGAFNSVKDPSYVLDYGWGAYNPVAHKLEGSRIFVLKKRDGSFIKFFVDQLDAKEYKFRFADLDGGNEWRSFVSKSDAQGGFVYYSFTTKDKVDMPSNYDLIFTRYNTLVTTGPSVEVSYTVTGTLIAPGIEAVVIKDVDPKDINEADYRDKFSSTPNTIGYDWKTFDQSGAWLVDSKRTQLIKTRNGDIYQLTFTGFGGTQSGEIIFDKRRVGSVSTTDTYDNKEEVLIFPNPALETVSIVSEHEVGGIDIIDQTGRLVRHFSSVTDNRVDVKGLELGVYTLIVHVGQKKIAHKLVIAH